MAKDTPIQWCDSAANGVMGCDGCELWVPSQGIEHCYAGQIHKVRAGNPGYADDFNIPKMFPGRMEKAASWSDLRGQVRPEKPWLNGMPRLIFISDMGDALSKDIPLEFLRDEVIGAATSQNGKRHMWLWPTKQPHRMIKLAELIGGWPDNICAMTSVTSAEQLGRVRHLLRVPAKYRGISYEPALGPVDWTSILMRCMECGSPGRKSHAVGCNCPARESTGIDWLIVGGESGPRSRPFDLEFARSAIIPCNEAGVALFVKQLGSRAYDSAAPGAVFPDEAKVMVKNAKAGSLYTPGLLRVGKDKKGGEMDKWPAELRIRQMPPAWLEAT